MEKSISFDTGLPTPPPKFAFQFLIDVCRDLFPENGNLRFTRLDTIDALLLNWRRREMKRVSLSVRQLRFIKKKIATHTLDLRVYGVTNGLLFYGYFLFLDPY